MPRKRPSKKTTIPSQAPGVNAGEQDANVRDTIILFADIIGASEVSNHKTPKQYFEFVREFQQMFDRICEKYLGKWYPDEKDYLFQARGDEGLLMIFPKSDQDNPRIPGQDVDVAVNIALALKREWIQSEDNVQRIRKSKLLPVDLGIGIHLGPTLLHKDDKIKSSSRNPGSYAPEGYAINLAKRIESHSRGGRYTNIFISGAAHGAWRRLPDEYTYIFDEEQSIEPRGITRKIPVFEVKHHFLPTDWYERSETRKRGKSLLDPDEVDPELLKAARELNPTNIWLTEESIRANMLKNYYDIPSRKRDNKEERKKAFKEARSIADYLASSDQQDAGILLIQGLIEGECHEFASERKKYERAMTLSPILVEAHWYTALSYSFEVADRLSFDTSLKITDLSDSDKELVENALKSFMEANGRSFMSAWIPFDYGCELIRWAEDDIQLNEGIQKIQLASKLFPEEVADAILEESYLDKVLDDPRIKSLLPTNS